jgi:Ca-activated chloride channel family protein
MKLASNRRAGSLCLGLICAALLGAASARPGWGEPGSCTADAEGGALLLRAGKNGRCVPAPVLDTDAALWVTGVVARARVTQRFRNPGDDRVEAVYVFPLPDAAAVDHLRMLVGRRVIEGQIRERGRARRIYEAARSTGQKASLLEQERPNIFTASVANIGPRETVEVVLEYQEVVRWDGGEFGVRFPLAITPRYTPGGPPAGTPEAPDTAETGPITRARFSDLADAPVRLAVEIDAGFALSSLYSPSHEIRTSRVSDTVYEVALDPDAVPADRDFVLRWAPERGQTPEAALFTEGNGGDTYALLMVLPPDPDDAGDARLPRETVFVIDTSGSMAGPSLEQAKLALMIALDDLAPGDRFNVIEFNSVTRRLFPESVTADAAAIERARHFIDSLDANGGTEMADALAAALEGDPPRGFVRQIVFVTDGAVGNESALFAYIGEHLGASRLFPVGIGSAPNSYFMRKAAQFGRGAFTFIGSPLQVSERMDALFRKLESPVLTGLEVSWDDPAAEAWPARIPDLYAGEPLVVTARLTGPVGRIQVRGERGERSWEKVFRPGPPGGPRDIDPPARSAIAKLWARRKIDALMDAAIEGADREAARQAVVDLGLAHHLVTRYTSLVAVDVTSTAPPAAVPVPSHLPAAAAVGSLPATATPAPLYLCVALLLFAVALLARPVAATGRREGR